MNVRIDMPALAPGGTGAEGMPGPRAPGGRRREGPAAPLPGRAARGRFPPGGWTALPVGLLFGAALLPVALISLLAARTGLPLETFTKDPATVAGMNPLSGLLTNLGVLAWTAAAAVCLFAADRMRVMRTPGRAGFYLAGGVLTSVLLVDDLFLVHEYWGPRYLGLPEQATYGLYALAGLAWLVRYRAEVLRNSPGLLVATLTLFAFSVVGDLVVPEADRTLPLEDGAKWLGIVGWLAWWWTAARNPPAGEVPPGS